MSREMRGHGTVYQRGAVFWIQYSLHGDVYRESSHSAERKAALKLLKHRLAETTRGKVIGPVAERVTLREMAEAVLADYALNGYRSAATAAHFTRVLMGYFGENCRALDITSDRIAKYAETRQQQGKSNASINRETACLIRMFNLMIKAGRLSRDSIPSRTYLKEAEARQGFIEPADFARLRDALPDYLREPASFMYACGWRVNAIRTLTWMRDLALEFDDSGKIIGGTVTLQAAHSKNKKPVILPLRGELLDVIRRAWAVRIPEVTYVFHRGALPIGDFRKAWRKACAAAGLGHVLPHDTRRSCARNLIRAGVSEVVAMRVTGHRTRSMFDRYNITVGSDLEKAMDRVSDYVTAREAEPLRPKVIPFAPRKVAIPA
jgi:integrase